MIWKWFGRQRSWPVGDITAFVWRDWGIPGGTRTRLAISLSRFETSVSLRSAPLRRPARTNRFYEVASWKVGHTTVISFWRGSTRFAFCSFFGIFSSYSFPFLLYCRLCPFSCSLHRLYFSSFSHMTVLSHLTPTTLRKVKLSLCLFNHYFTEVHWGVEV